ncbi:hypothetical protein LBMAG42_13380 [Deltaproteobacteria bacterium]|nr:hypothetical protein LBMAG42_13380 [Deltaproteobacteria bacterium]
MALLALVATACNTDGQDSGSACLAAGEGIADLDIELHSDFGRIAARVVAPTGGEPASMPVVVQLFGRWYSTTRPEEGNIAIENAVIVRVALAGADWGDGTDDARGPNARAAVAEAIRYAHGNAVDSEGCRIAERFPVANPSVTVLLGQSNGGNLAVATLADDALDVPQPAAVVTWETPAGAQFVNMEFGSTDEVYDPGSCTLDPAWGVSCALNATLSPTVDGNEVCFDLDHDGRCGAADATPHPPTDPATGLRAASPALADALATAGLASPWDNAEEARSFWATRDASRLAASAVARFPDLPFLLLGSEADHALSNLSDHPHVFGLGEVLQAAGARWVRLNPGSAFSLLAEENPVNLPLTLANPDAWLLPEDDENPLSALYAQAVSEVAAHEAADDW